MSSGGPYTLMTNIGLQDKLLTAHELLKKRINEYILKKDKTYTESDLATIPKGGYMRIENSVLPSLNEMEKTHNTLVNGGFRPCVPVAFEYIKVRNSRPKFGQDIEFMLPQIGNFINDMVVHVRISGFKMRDKRDRGRWVAMPGHKLFENVQLTVDSGVIVDEYTTDDYNAYYQHDVDKNHKTGWLRNIGQEIPLMGYMTSDPTFDMHREYKWIGNGNQTLKYNHDAIDLFIPLLFWFNNLKSALPTHIISWGTTQIKIKLAELTDMIAYADYGGGGLYEEPVIEFCDLYINNVFTTPDIYDIYAKKYVFSLIRVHRHHKIQLADDAQNYQEVLLHNLKWPHENITFSFRPRSNLSLSQYWYKNTRLIERNIKTPVVAKNTNSVITGTISSATGGTTSKAILVSGALSALDDTYNSYDFVITGGRGYNSQDITLNRYIVSDYNGTTKEITLSAQWTGPTPDNTTTFELFTPQLAINLITYQEEHPVVSEIGLSIDGNTVFSKTPEMFYNSYTTLRFGENGCTPEDRGSYRMNFNVHNNAHNPSGSINFSLCREIYLGFKSDYINKDNPVYLIVLGRAINFLLVDRGTMTLKYAT